MSTTTIVVTDQKTEVVLFKQFQMDVFLRPLQFMELQFSGLNK